MASRKSVTMTRHTSKAAMVNIVMALLVYVFSSPASAILYESQPVHTPP
jgi:hypothetical protein